ncbi:D-2-hydroxyacid dehydrogenase [Breznakiella homolactica]|uniref:D-2-hydroxyacid dehydrogenase n=1 Tax=Breznakiella homolactica TaxID=2798577 RepID=A0A7T7XJF7_9SPIR|nr:D-2-hydroxyacid dehydrogenase [Breznakiella homolactica]QQO07486.1 D-2-hydroxyacid dehydrogenase [Breznakiella homolactica]
MNETKKTNVLVLYTAGFAFTEEQAAALAKDYPQCDFIFTDDTKASDEMIEAAEVMVGFMKPDVVRKARNLKWLHLSSIGVDQHIDKSIYANPDILLTNSAGTYGKPISDHILGMMLALSRNMHIFRDQQRQSLWKKMDSTKDLFESTLCIIGLGDVGMELARKANALGMHVIGVKRTPARGLPCVDEVYTTEKLDEVLPRADFVVLSLATTPETAGLMSRDRLDKMKPDSYLINIGRGSLVDQDALRDSLAEGRIAGAAIDVTTPEPLPPDSPLWALPNLIITPHVSGKSPSTYRRHYEVFRQELGRYLSGEKLKNSIDFDLRY